MKKTEIEFNETEETFYCPVTNEELCSDGFVNLSKASLLYFWEPYSNLEIEFKNKLIEDNYTEYLNLLKREEGMSWEWDKEKIALKLLLNDLKKANKNLVLYTLNFYNSSLNFCIDMNYKPNK